MNSEKLPRRIRIQGNPGNVMGYAITITDLETGGVIPGIFAIDVHLEATGRNVAKVSYYETDDEDRVIAGPDKDAIKRTVEIEHPEIDVTAEDWD